MIIKKDCDFTAYFHGGEALEYHGREVIIRKAGYYRVVQAHGGFFVLEEEEMFSDENRPESESGSR